jgi:hypothetical protein
LGDVVRREKKEKKQENVRNKATTEVNSSIILVSVLLVTCKEVITIRQNPRRFTDVLKMCSDVFFAIYNEDKSGCYSS